MRLPCHSNKWDSRNELGYPLLLVFSLFSAHSHFFLIVRSCLKMSMAVFVSAPCNIKVSISRRLSLRRQLSVRVKNKCTLTNMSVSPWRQRRAAAYVMCLLATSSPAVPGSWYDTEWRLLLIFTKIGSCCRLLSLVWLPNQMWECVWTTKVVTTCYL